MSAVAILACVTSYLVVGAVVAFVWALVAQRDEERFNFQTFMEVDLGILLIPLWGLVIPIVLPCWLLFRGYTGFIDGAQWLGQKMLEGRA